MKTTNFLLSASLTSLFLLFLSCSKNNCDSNTCLNGGLCIKGDCDCPEQYEGPSCADQKTPSKMVITSIKVTSFPGQVNWDTQDGPDIYWQITNGDDTLFVSDTSYENASAEQDYLFNAHVEITGVTSLYYLQLIDDDYGQSEDDFMGGVPFILYPDNTGGFPTTIELLWIGQVSFVITVNYEW